MGGNEVYRPLVNIDREGDKAPKDYVDTLSDFHRDYNLGSCPRVNLANNVHQQ